MVKKFFILLLSLGATTSAIAEVVSEMSPTPSTPSSNSCSHFNDSDIKDFSHFYCTESLKAYLLEKTPYRNLCQKVTSKDSHSFQMMRTCSSLFNRAVVIQTCLEQIDKRAEHLTAENIAACREVGGSKTGGALKSAYCLTIIQKDTAISKIKACGQQASDLQRFKESFKACLTQPQ